MSNINEAVTAQAWKDPFPTTDLRSRLATIVAAVIAACAAWRANRRDIAHLEAMDERMLRDIGLARSEIGRAVRFGRYGG
ncbi:MAG: DUF1127 domain-containing protein [Hyphomicrobiaceae bacterium]